MFTLTLSLVRRIKVKKPNLVVFMGESEGFVRYKGCYRFVGLLEREPLCSEGDKLLALNNPCFRVILIE
ncbi:hypothetical protein OBCHQ24_14710 [Oceanobacillus iheyensis]|nr:hypothetical protein OBCHQ24_14710 [Oceanobacillus iheyensis]